MKKRYFTAIIMLVSILIEPFICSAMRINEIMYNPEGDDNNKEFIEIYIETWTNISGWKIADSDSNDTLQMAYYSETNPSYALITEEGFNFAGINATIYSAGASIGNNLGNSADSIYLYTTNGTLVDSASYDGLLANGNGKSMEFLNGEWHESCSAGGSPGMENCNPDSGGKNSTNSTDNTDDGSNSAAPQDMDECRPIIVAYTDREMYNSTDKVSIYFALYNETFPYRIEYWVEDSSGNMAKSRYNTSNTNTKTWTPELDEKDGVFFLKSNLYLYCGDELREGYSESMFIVFNTNAEKRAESEIIIKEVYTGTDEKIEFGQPLRVNVEVYKGDESGSTVELWVENNEGEKVSQATKALFYDRFTEYDITLPIQLKPNCDEGYNNGAYTLVVEGFDMRQEQKVDIEGITGSLCPAGQGKSSSSTSGSSGSSSEGPDSGSAGSMETKISYQLLNFNNEMETGREIANELLIQNDDEAHRFDVWSYVYKGSKCYSGEREENMQSLDLAPGESVIVELKNILNDAAPGDYKFKVKVKKDDQKTNYEMTKDVEISKANESDAGNETGGIINKGLKDLTASSAGRAAGDVVYEGSSAKSRKLAPVFLLLSIFLVAIIGLKRWIKGAKRPKNRPRQTRTAKENI